MGILFLDNKVLVLVLFMLAGNFILCSCRKAEVGCTVRERRALLAFKQSLTDPSNRLSSWTGQDCCSWDGVLCNNATGHVTKLDLRNPKYIEDIDYKTTWLIGTEVSPSLAEMRHLEFLDLSRNNFSESNIPGFFGNFKSLTSLHLSDASFSGSVPHSLGNLSTLQELDLSGLAWLKVDNLHWLSQLSALQILDLSSVDLSQVSDLSRVFNSFPSLLDLYLKGCKLSKFPLSSQSYNNLTNVETLDLSANRFSGRLPDLLSQLRNLQFLDVSSNSFSGLIPSSFLTKSSSLKSLDLSSNQFNGTIPESIGQLSNLHILSLRHNFLGGIVSEIHFDKLSSLSELDMSFNSLAMNVSSDWIPPFQLDYLDLGSWRFRLGFPRWLQRQKFIQIIHIPNAEISGPNHFEDIVPLLPSNVEELDLSNCSISGSIPPSVGNILPNLSVLKLSHNNISGSIPTSLCGMRSLSFLYLSNNHLVGDLPENCWSDTRDMVILDLSSNSLTGSLPSSIGNMSRLFSLHLSNNKFSGELPLAMKSCTNLRILDLATNGFSGTIPSWVKGLSSLRILNLKANKFDGHLGHELCAISKLGVLNLARNGLMGTIPSCFGNLTGMAWGGSMEISDFFGYDDSLKQVMKGRELDLSSNNLEGHIPEELTSLSELRNLNLSHNILTGWIPEKIGNLKSLKALDLSHNHLSGMIPPSISKLSYLTFLDLSYNNFSGKNPTGKQL